MVRKRTIEEVKTWAIAQGYLLLSSVYENARTKLSFVCPKGHEFPMTWNDMSQGKGCAECGGSKKKTLAEIEVLSSDRGFTLIPGQLYKNSGTKLNFICAHGHNFSMRWDDMTKGKGCMECSGRRKKTLEEIGTLSLEKGFSLIPGQIYKSNKVKLNFICPEDHEFWMTWDSMSRGVGCPKCIYKAETLLGGLLAGKYKVDSQHKVPCPITIRKSGKIRVDFYLPETNTIVEYHGKQHYEWVPFLHKTEQEFEKQQTRDQWLRDYCFESGINYWEISYLEFNHHSTKLPGVLNATI